MNILQKRIVLATIISFLTILIGICWEFKLSVGFSLAVIAFLLLAFAPLFTEDI